MKGKGTKYHNEAIVCENREAVQTENAGKVAEQYAAMGLLPKEGTAEGSAGTKKAAFKLILPYQISILESICPLAKI